MTERTLVWNGFEMVGKANVSNLQVLLLAQKMREIDRLWLECRKESTAIPLHQTVGNTIWSVLRMG